MASVGPPKDGVGGGVQRSPPHSTQQGQSFQPLDKASSQTVKVSTSLVNVTSFVIVFVSLYWLIALLAFQMPTKEITINKHFTCSTAEPLPS